jgi:hypothetical protein
MKKVDDFAHKNAGYYFFVRKSNCLIWMTPLSNKTAALKESCVRRELSPSYSRAG